MSRRVLSTGGALLSGALGVCSCGGGDGGPANPETPDRGTVQVDRVGIVSTPAAGETYLAGEELRFGVWLTSGAPVEAAGDVFLIFDLGLAREPAKLMDISGERLEFRYRVRRGDYDGDGVGIPAGELSFSPGASLRVGGADLDPNVPELLPLPEHRVFAHYAPGDPVVFDPVPTGSSFELPGVPNAVGCGAPEDLAPIVEAVLDGNLPRAASLWSAARQIGRCVILDEGEPAIFLSAAVAGHGGAIYDLVMAYGIGAASGGERITANWWTLANFLSPAP